MYKSRRNKLRTYELLSIIKPNIDSEEFDKIVAKIEENIATLGGKVVSTDKMGRKRLAFEVASFRDGFFVAQKLQIPADKVVDFKRMLKLNDNVIRTMFVEASKVSA